ncbi:type II 3-dehydroquinate dehydratase [Christiangramia echinicola]|uniref:3-dehydroquinate dehydratase n=1 Tax=Christiangramia echinicola TaxID=279359 RepID=A0A1H1R2J1_9FLAO|nr:type II 3-dehydroquinate dehydratase [Christiangramia echinicola]SDS29745.1 3-dehydroquinate dehydratase [Christiangramia echinicola]
MKLLILNGPNLNLLGIREPEKYGNKSFDDYFSELQFQFRNVELSFDQTNIEGELIDKIQNARKDFDGIILNAAAYTHTSVGIGDAVAAIDIPVVEVHISNTFSREEFRHKSYISPIAKGIIVGFGLQSYDLAIQSFLNTKDD